MGGGAGAATRRASILPAVIAVLISLGLSAPAGAAESTTRERAEAIYERGELDREIPTGWTGSVAGCKVGTESRDSIEATFRTINAIRELAGIPLVEENAEMNRKALAAALVFQAAGDISHEIDRTWKCWSRDAEDGAAHSNLSGAGETGSQFIWSYINEGPDFGHRLNVMNPGLFEMGTGSSRSWNANYTIGGERGGERYDLMNPDSTVAWPAAGWFPGGWVPQHWSVALGNVDTQESFDVSSADVSVTVDGSPVDVTIGTDDRSMSANVYGIGQPFSWQVDLPRDFASEDHEIAVEIADLTSAGEPFPVAYTVKTFATEEIEPPDPEPSAECLAAESRLKAAKQKLAQAKRSGRRAKIRRARKGVARANAAVAAAC